MIDEYIVPTLKKDIGKDYVFFNYESPSFYQRNENEVEISVASLVEVNGVRASYEESYSFIFNCNEKKIISFYKF